jgi:hypothetical protein
VSYHKVVPWLAGCLAGLFLSPAAYTLLRMN